MFVFLKFFERVTIHNDVRSYEFFIGNRNFRLVFFEYDAFLLILSAIKLLH